MEYQAKELFAKHGVPVTLGTVVDHARGGAGRRRGARRSCVVKAQVKAGGRGKAGGVKLAKTPDEAVRARVEHPRHGDQGPDRQPGAGRAGRRRIEEEYYFSFLLDRANRAVPLHRQRRGRRRDRGGRQDQPRRRQADPDRPGHRRRRGQGPRDRRPRPGSPTALADQAVAMVQALWKVFVEEDATLVEVNPLARLERRQARGARRQGLARRERRVPARGPRGSSRIKDDDRPARGQGQGEGPQLRQARRRGRHHRQRRGPGHVAPSTSSRTPARSTAASSRPTSSTSAAAPTPR